MSVPRCSLIIRSYKEEKHIGRLLEGVMHQGLRDVVVSHVFYVTDRAKEDHKRLFKAAAGDFLIHLRYKNDADW